MEQIKTILMPLIFQLTSRYMYPLPKPVFLRMHVAPAKTKCDRQTDGRTK